MKHYLLRGDKEAPLIKRAQELMRELLPSVQQISDMLRIHELAGLDTSGRPAVPMRSPHHSVSVVGLTGSVRHGYVVRPGELSIAHGGVLLLDSGADWAPEKIDVIVQAAVLGRVMLRCEKAVVTVPSEFQLIVIERSCRCGGTRKTCLCSPEALSKLEGRLQPFRTICETLVI